MSPVKAKRKVYTFAYLKGAAGYFAGETKRSEHAQELLSAMMSCVASAFYLEAALNHLGDSVLPFWSELERKLSPEEKLNVLCSHLQIELDRSKRPAQTLGELTALRNTLAHGKTRTTIVQARRNERGNFSLKKDKAPQWDFGLRRERARVCYRDVCEVVDMLYQAAGIPVSEGVTAEIDFLPPSAVGTDDHDS